MEYNFDEIRCFNSEEIPAAMERLCSEKQFVKIVSTLFPLMPKEQLKQKILSFKTSKDFQKELVFPFLQYLEANMTTGIELQGLENIDLSKNYLFISNHRDIILDSAFLGGKFMEKGLDTMEIAIGDNLLVFPWIKDLVRVNKSFIVQRGLNTREILDSSKRLSAYMMHALHQKHQSIWIAQREGRAKDSDDRTQESILKMLNLNGKGNFIENIKEFNICPISISYEYDPCDFLKAKEFQQKRDDLDYKKTQQDDLENMSTGVMGYKGKVVYYFAGSINGQLDEIAVKTNDKKEQIELVTKLIDYHIHKNYHITSNNRIAYDLLVPNHDQSVQSYTPAEKETFELYLDKQIRKVNLENKDRIYLRDKMLEMYANPLKNYLISNDEKSL